MPTSTRTNEQISSSALNTLSAPKIEVISSPLIILFIQWKIRVVAQIFLKLVKALIGLGAGKQLLADWSEQLHNVRPHQTRYFLCHYVRRRPVAPQEPRPDTSVNNDSHERLRRILL